MTFAEKLCECGCGNPVTIARNTQNGSVRGEPNRFLHGHNCHLIRQRKSDPSEKLRIKPRLRHANMTRDQLFTAHRVYLATDMAIADLGRQIWLKFGYKNPKSASDAIRHSFKLYGLPTKSQLAKRPRCGKCGWPILEDEINEDCYACRERMRSKARRVAA